MHFAAVVIGLAAALSGCAGLGKCGLRECPADAKITAEVRALLAQHPALGSSISVQTIDGVVYLRGIVSTPYQIADAGSIAERAAGVNAVENMVVIDNSR